MRKRNYIQPFRVSQAPVSPPVGEQPSGTPQKLEAVRALINALFSSRAGKYSLTATLALLAAGSLSLFILMNDADYQLEDENADSDAMSLIVSQPEPGVNDDHSDLNMNDDDNETVPPPPRAGKQDKTDPEAPSESEDPSEHQGDAVPDVIPDEEKSDLDREWIYVSPEQLQYERKVQQSLLFMDSWEENFTKMKQKVLTAKSKKLAIEFLISCLPQCNLLPLWEEQDQQMPNILAEKINEAYQALIGFFQAVLALELPYDKALDGSEDLMNNHLPQLVHSNIANTLESFERGRSHNGAFISRTDEDISRYSFELMGASPEVISSVYRRDFSDRILNLQENTPTGFSLEDAIRSFYRYGGFSVPDGMPVTPSHRSKLRQIAREAFRLLYVGYEESIDHPDQPNSAILHYQHLLSVFRKFEVWVMERI